VTTARQLVILGYHRIGSPAPDGWETWFQISRPTFVEQLAAIRRSGWTVLDVATLVAGLGDPDRLPERSVVITFDDGYRCMVDVALPCLQQEAMPAILFIPTDHVGSPNAFDPGEPPGRICDWDDLAVLERQGVSVQSHAASHRAFSDLSLNERVEELRRSKNALDEALGRPTRLFAYPFGDVGGHQTSLEAHAELLGYAGACLYPGGTNELPGAHPFRLERNAMGPDTNVAAILTGGS
jgi:peptidoglycan/xylan/chitin deacetylase (PgdA/CDA1 family)